MHKTYLGQKGYSIYKDSISIKEAVFIREELMMKPYVPKSPVQPEAFPIYKESPKKFYVPRIFGITNFGEPNEVKIDNYDKIDIKFAGDLREQQQIVVDKFILNIDNGNCGGLLDLYTGFGKTVVALKLIAVIGVKTLIIVHKGFLVDQWTERIQEYLPDARIGKIQGQIIDIEDKDIVIIMLQSLSQKEYPEELFHDFGFVCCDECFKGHTLIHTNKGKLKISELYNTWENKKEKNDIEILKRDLFNEYQLIENELQNTTNPELIELLEISKKHIIDSMDILKIKKNDFSNLKYFNSHEFINTLTNEMTLCKYDKFIEILSFFKNFFKLFLQDKEIDNKLDITFIQQQLQHNVLSINEINQLFVFMFQLMKKIHAPVHDENVNNYIQEIIQNDSNTKIPQFILNLLSCIKNLVQDLEKLK